MKIFASGDGTALHRDEESREIKFGRVVGVIDLGANNGDNIFGWCGDKAVVSSDGKLWILDHPEEVKIYTNDDILVDEGYQIGDAWFPSIKEAHLYDLYIYPNSYRGI